MRDVRVWLECAAAGSSGGQRVRRWADGGEAAIDLGRQAAPYQARPDAWFIYRVRQAEGDKEKVLVGLVEVDRGTERGKTRWVEKIEAYGSLFGSDRLRQATGYRKARVLVLTPSAVRRDALAELIAREIGTSGLAERFWLAETAALQEASLAVPVWRRIGVGPLVPLVE